MQVYSPEAIKCYFYISPVMAHRWATEEVNGCEVLSWPSQIKSINSGLCVRDAMIDVLCHGEAIYYKEQFVMAFFPSKKKLKLFAY